MYATANVWEVLLDEVEGEGHGVRKVTGEVMPDECHMHTWTSISIPNSR